MTGMTWSGRCKCVVSPPLMPNWRCGNVAGRDGLCGHCRATCTPEPTPEDAP